MNQRIKELAAQQGLTGPNYLISSQELEKFAELIIQDCISVAALVGLSNYENEDISWAAHKIVEQTKEHFGLK